MFALGDVLQCSDQLHYSVVRARHRFDNAVDMPDRAVGQHNARTMFFTRHRIFDGLDADFPNLGNVEVGLAALPVLAAPRAGLVGWYRFEEGSGTVVADASLRVEVTATGDDTTLAGIQRLVADAQASRSRTQALADRAAALLFYVAIVAGAVTALVWTLLGQPSFALDRSDQFRPPPPPKVGSEQMKKEVDEVIKFNATLTPEQKAVVEFMRDGPRSTGQSGHWLQFAEDLSRRDHYDLDRDVKLFFSVGNVVMDAFIAANPARRETLLDDRTVVVDATEGASDSATSGCSQPRWASTPTSETICVFTWSGSTRMRGVPPAGPSARQAR